jgi:hypothetical protein
LGPREEFTLPDYFMDSRATIRPADVAHCLCIGIATSFGRTPTSCVLWQRLRVNGSGSLCHWLIPRSPKGIRRISSPRWPFTSTRHFLAGCGIPIWRSSYMGTTTRCNWEANHKSLPTFSVPKRTDYPVPGATTAYLASSTGAKTRTRVYHL